jgi:hypothetical protein
MSVVVVQSIGIFVPLTIAPANLLFVFSIISLARHPNLRLGLTASVALVPSEIFKIFFTVLISDIRSFSAFRIILIFLLSEALVLSGNTVQPPNDDCCPAPLQSQNVPKVVSDIRLW